MKNPKPIEPKGTVMHIRVNGPRQLVLRNLAEQERRKITNLVQVMIEEGIEKRTK